MALLLPPLPLVLIALIFAMLAVLLFYFAYRTFGTRRRAGRSPAAPVAAPAAAPPALAVAAQPFPTYAPPAARHASALAAAAYSAPPAHGVAYLTLDVTAHFYPLHALPCVIGCEPGCMVEVPDRFDKVSRRHAQIERSGDDYILADLGSTNGVWVNEARVGRILLRDGTLFSLGRQVGCTFHLNA